MIVKAYQTAFHQEGPVKIREIVIPDSELPEIATPEKILDLAFYYGQNDFQPVADRYSVSAGDVIELPDGQLFRIMGCGFVELPADEGPAKLVGSAARRAGGMF